MNRLTRTRSQHFVGSPRKVASPMKQKHAHALALGLGRHASKRRRVGSTGITARSVDTNEEADQEEIENEDESAVKRAKGKGKEKVKGWEPLSSEGGSQRVNRGVEVVIYTNRRGKGKGRAGAVPAEKDVFDGSPRKRKRKDVVADSTEEVTEQEDEGGGMVVEASIAGSGSWVEIDEDDQDEEEPEFIAESDQHLLADAPAYALHRLKKAELIRLWRVAGMWKEEDDGATTSSTGDDDGLAKKDLVDGLIAARKPESPRRISPLPSPRALLRAKAAAGHKSRSSLSSRFPSPSPSLSPPTELDQASVSIPNRKITRMDIDATPKAVVRTRARTKPIRTTDGTPARGSASRRLGTKVRKNGRVARFGDDVKSPAHGLVAKKDRHETSSLSSLYTTTDDSGSDNAPVARTTRRTRKRAQSQSKRHSDSSDERANATEGSADGSDEDAQSSSRPHDPTPLVARLRSRTKSLVEIAPPPSEPDADDENEETEDEEDASPGPSRRTRSQGNLFDSSDSGRTSSQNQLRRGSKVESAEAVREDDDDEMELDEDAAMASPDEINDEEVDDDTTSDGNEADADEQTETEAPVRTTRSGKAFGELRSRRWKLRQEAMDDPDMEVDEDEGGEEAEDEEEEMEESDEGSVQEFDIDLDDATAASLTRLLRDELVQLCEARGIEVGGTKPQLAKALLEWRDEQRTGSESPTSSLSSSSQVTARPTSPKTSTSRSSRSRHTTKNRIIHAIGSNKHVKGKTTPVLLRDHVHATDPATPQHSDEGKQEKESELNFDLAELGLEDSIILPEHLTKLERIGSGGFKDVYVGKCKGRKVAISEFRSHLSEMDIRELKLLAEFSHPNIVRFRGICIPEDSSQVQCMLVSELCENGDLFDYIRNVGAPNLKRLLGLMLDIARGLEYLHTRRPAIIHRDCKSSNILINRAGQAKVGDFGLARVKTSTRSMIRSLVGTVNWQAPELWHASPRYDYKVDVFSAGMVYWEMMSGWTADVARYPWEGNNEHYIYDVVGQKSRRPSVAGLRKHWGAEPVNLMERMWHQDPAERPTMSDVVADLEALIAEA